MKKTKQEPMREELAKYIIKALKVIRFSDLQTLYAVVRGMERRAEK